MDKAKKGTVSIFTQDDRLMIGFRYQGKRYRFSLGYPDEPAYRVKAQQLASTIQLDIISGNFDPTLAKYRDKPAVERNTPESKKVKRPKGKKYNSRNNPRRQSFTTAEIKMIIDAFRNDTFTSRFSTVPDSYYANLAECWAILACRNAEIISLTFDKIHWSSRTVEISQVYARANNSTVFKNRTLKPYTKNGDIRFIPMNDRLYELLSEQRAKFENHPQNKLNLVFPSPKTFEVIDDGNWRTRIYKKIVTGLELPYRIPYSFGRISRASNLLSSGMPINSVSAVLGHRSVDTTVRYYIKGRMPDKMPDL